MAETRIPIETLYDKLIQRMGEIVSKYEVEIALRDTVIDRLNKELTEALAEVEKYTEPVEDFAVGIAEGTD